MFKQARMGTIAAFISGVVVGVGVLMFLGGGRAQTTTAAAQAAEQTGEPQAGQPKVLQVGRYQAIAFVKNGSATEPGGYAGLLDTATGKVWSLRALNTSPLTWVWARIAEGPK